jgi:hypothetical protein
MTLREVWIEVAQRVLWPYRVATGPVYLAACFRTLVLVFLAESARSRRWPQFKYAGYSRFGRLDIVPIALKNPSALVRKQAASPRPHQQ